MKLAFTGHRPESLPFGENENDARCIRLKAMLLTEIMDRAKAGYNGVYRNTKKARETTGSGYAHFYAYWMEDDGFTDAARSGV